MADTIISHFKSNANNMKMSSAAKERAKDFTADSIIGKLLKDTGLA
jgi:hypothetical protein